jgi:hypothetical protein
MNKILSLFIILTLLAACDYTPLTSQSAPGSEVGTTGNIQFTHERLNARRHFLTLTAAPGIGETESSISQRMHQFSVRFAATTCPSAYRFIDDQNMQQSTAVGFMRRTRSYVFDCT